MVIEKENKLLLLLLLLLLYEPSVNDSIIQGAGSALADQFTTNTTGTTGHNDPWRCNNGTNTATNMQGFIRPVAHVGSGDPVRVLRLYTTNTLDEAFNIYC